VVDAASILIAAAVFGWAAPTAQGVQAGSDRTKWEEAARRVTRLSPAAFPDLPARIRSLMEADGCRVPQDPSLARPHNVVSGEFAGRGQRDWAAFCSANGTTTVRIYWGGPIRCPALGYSGSDVSMLQDYEFYMHLGADSPQQLVAAAKEFDLKIPSITHDALDIGSEKGGSAKYCDRGKWISVVTSD